jgi:hypothetical protein
VHVCACQQHRINNSSMPCCSSRHEWSKAGCIAQLQLLLPAALLCVAAAHKQLHAAGVAACRCQVQRRIAFLQGTTQQSPIRWWNRATGQPTEEPNMAHEVEQAGKIPELQPAHYTCY